MNEQFLDKFRKLLRGMPPAVLAEQLDTCRDELEYQQARTAMVAAEALRRMDEAAADRSDCGFYELVRKPGSAKYVYNLTAVPRVLDLARQAGDDCYKLALTCFPQVYEVKKTPLNKLGKYGGELKKAIDGMVESSRGADSVSVVLKV